MAPESMLAQEERAPASFKSIQWSVYVYLHLPPPFDRIPSQPLIASGDYFMSNQPQFLEATLSANLSLPSD